MRRRAVAIRHVAFEGLGVLDQLLAERDYTVEFIDACSDLLTEASTSDCDLLVVFGGPIGAYAEHAYQFVTKELSLLETRFAPGGRRSAFASARS